MRVGVIQSNYLPWRGYFDFIDQTDLFVFHDDLQYTKGDWRNRNKLKASEGLKWITVPVKYAHTEQLICDTPIDYSTDWCRRHRDLFRAHYADAPYFRDAAEILEQVLAPCYATISELNINALKTICPYLGITTPVAKSTDYALRGNKTERLVELLKKLGANIYLSGPAAKSYLDASMFAEQGIDIEYKVYNYAPYPQLWGAFEGAVSILDLIANCGPHARRRLSSNAPNVAAAGTPS